MWISRKDFEDFKRSSQELIATLDELKKKSFLIDVQRQGRVNRFTFCRGEEVITIETMGLIGDNLPEWKEKLLR